MKRNIIYLWGCILVVMTGCSTTKHLPDDELLYTGIDKITIQNEDKSKAGENALAEVEAAISIAPNNAIFGSAKHRYPMPIGLWIYNRFERYEKGLGHWIFKKFAADPVYLSKVNPETRVKVATNLLHDYGYFQGKVTYSEDSTKHPKTIKLSYNIDMQHGYHLDSIRYEGFDTLASRLINESYNERIIHSGDHFDVTQLHAERERLARLFKNNGYYYFRPEFISFLADTIMNPGFVNLKVMPQQNIPDEAKRIYYIGNTSVYMTGHNGEPPVDSLVNQNFTVHYHGKKPGLKYNVLRNRFLYQPGDRYSQMKQDYTQEALSRLGVFRYNEFEYTPRSPQSDTLDIKVNTTFDLPFDSELELNLTTKSTKQTGPGAIFKLTKKNFCDMGAALNFELYGSYEWQTSSTVDGGSSKMNSYELGTSLSLDFPRLVLPWSSRRIYARHFPSETKFKIYAEQINRAQYFKVLSFGGSTSYSFQKRRSIKHTVTPLHLAFNTLQKSTARFDSISSANPMLFLSLDNQFIPSQSYTLTFDNSYLKHRNRIWWENSITSAGNITSLIYAAFGHKFSDKDKKMLGTPYAQFLKFSSEFRHVYFFSEKHQLASRLMAGVVWAYGNKNIAPYSEQFYVGGANSIRAFTVRSIGPGSFHPAKGSKFSYVDETGDLKFEANLEYRFRLVSNFLGGDLNGATFIDAGNVWLLRNDPARPGSKFRLSKMADSIALGTGIGIRYDLSFLILRLDWGIALHVPYETGKSGYYNIPRFKDGTGLHFAIGYPF